MSQSDHSCKAILEQGSNKGKQCERPKLENGFCAKHMKQAALEKDLEGGLRKCSTHRCTITFTPLTNTTIEYCDTCKKAKEEHLKTIILCKWEKLECKKQARISGFCGKHEPRALLLKEAEEKNIRICDDGKRGCRNQTIENKVRCEDCLEKEREKSNKKYKERQENLNICLGCGKEIQELLDGFRMKVQRCLSCYEKLRKVEETRGPRDRNYLVENKANIDKYLASYIQCARNRNIAFELTKENFESLVSMACYYCAYYNEDEVIGIDRLNSKKHYTLDNCVACCKMCNFMKGTLSRNTFILQAHKIANKFPVNEIIKEEVDTEVTVLSSLIPPTKVAEIYRNDKFNLYLEACIRDKRSTVFIERLKTIENKKLSYREFLDFFRKCCKADSKLCASHLSHDRKRLSYKELYDYFNNENSEYAIELYQAVHGVMGGFKEDMEELADTWNVLSFDERTSGLYSIMIKYQNQRAHGTVKKIPFTE
jgi:hypothetical protein